MNKYYTDGQPRYNHNEAMKEAKRLGVNSDAIVSQPEFPDPICMDCGKICYTWEIINDRGNEELWCYCKKCDVETFHPKIEAG